MHNQLFFCVVFFCQILLISGWMARKNVSNMRARFSKYPPAEYPRLYPLPPVHYGRIQQRYIWTNVLIGSMGLAIVAVLLLTPRDGEWDHAIATGYGLLQYLPLVLWESSRRAELQMMRDVSTTRRAQLAPRRVMDVVPRTLLTMAVAVYLLLIPFVIVVNQFDFPWFGGYLNIAIITAMNIGFSVTLVLQVHGKKLDPYLKPLDRQSQLTQMARLLLLISIAATVFAMLSISLQIFDLQHLKGTAHSLYFQLLALLAFPTYQPLKGDYSVYKESPSAA